MDTTNVLEPRCVVVVGASDNMRKPGARVLRNILTHGFQGEVFVVHPSTSLVQGLNTYPEISSLPKTPELAIVAIPFPAALAAFEECAIIGVPTVLVLSAMRVDDLELREKFTEARNEYPDTRLIGPNSLGVHSFHASLAGSFMTATETDFEFEPSDLAIVSQSGGVGGYLVSIAQAAGLPVGSFISTGIELDVNFSEVLMDITMRYSPKVVFAYIEGAENKKAVVNAIEHAHNRGTAVILIRAGSSPEGRLALKRHSGLPSWDETEWEDALDPKGIFSVHSLEQAVDIARALIYPKVASGDRVSILVASGGAGVLMADAVARQGLRLARWKKNERESLSKLLPPYANVENPMDATGSLFSPLETMAKLLEQISHHDGTDIIIVALGNMPHLEDAIFDILKQAANRTPKLIAVVWSGGSPDAVLRLWQHGILSYSEPQRCAKSLYRALTHPARNMRE